MNDEMKPHRCFQLVMNRLVNVVQLWQLVIQNRLVSAPMNKRHVVGNYPMK